MYRTSLPTFWQRGLIPFEDVTLTELKTVITGYTSALETGVAGSEEEDATMLCLNGIAQGVDVDERTGREVFLRGIEVRGDIQLATRADADNPEIIVRFILVLDTQTNGAQMNAEDCYLPGLTHPEHSFVDMNGLERFRILEDITIPMQSPAAAGNGTANDWCGIKKVFSIGKSLGIAVNFGGTGATVADIQDNSLHILAWSSFDGGVGPFINYQTRIFYTD